MWLKACTLDELTRKAVCTVRSDALDVAVFRLVDGRVCAIEDRCPHRGAKLSRGLVYEGDKVACLDHGWSVRLSDGGVEPPEQGCVRTFTVKVEGGVGLVFV